MHDAELRILLFSFNYGDRMMAEVPYLRFSAERGLAYLDELRRPGVRVAAVTSAPVDQYTLEYHLRDVLRLAGPELEDARGRLTLLAPRPAGPGALDASVLADPVLPRILRGLAERADRAGIVDFAATAPMDELAARTGARAEERDFPLIARWGGKAGGKEILLRAGVAVPEGTADVVRDQQGIVEVAARLASGPRPARRVMAKLNSGMWAASIGNVLIDCGRLRETGDPVAAAEAIRLPADEWRRELARDGAIVEEFVEDVVSSPSGLGHIAEDGAVRVVASHDQVLSGGQYWGCRFPARDESRPAIADAVARTGRVLAGIGVRGTFGVDFVATGGGELLAVEVNLRKVGPSHVVRYAESLTGARVGPDGLLRREDGGLVYYVHERLHEPGAFGDLEPKTVVERLREEGLLYRHDTGEGVALHVLGALKACGFVELTFLAGSREAADAGVRAARSVVMGLGGAR